MNRRRTAFFLFLAVAAVSLTAVDWPAPPDSLVGTFGESREGRFRQGILLGHPDGKVVSYSDGEVVWSDRSISPGYRHPSGDMIVIEHTGGFRSLYLGIDVIPRLPQRVVEGETLGYSGPKPWFFSVTDRADGRSVNPLTLLPSRENAEPPVLVSAHLSDGVRTVDLDGEVFATAGSWSVVAEFAGPDGSVPYHMSLFWLGAQVTEFRLDALGENGVGLVMEGPQGRPFDAIFDEAGRLILGDVRLFPGRGDLEIRYRDVEGRGGGHTWRVEVTP